MLRRWQRVRSALRGELAPMFHFAWPVAMAELGWMAMGLVDTMMVGRVSAEAIGAVSIGSHVYFVGAIAGIGLLLGLDFLVSRAVGSGQAHDARHALTHGVYLSLAVGALLTAVLLAVSARLELFGIQPAVVREAEPYLRVISWSLVPMLLYTALRRYLQALGAVRVIMVALVSANVVNAAVNWVLIFGHLGAPALGTVGAAWATTASRVYLLLFLLAFAVRLERRTGARLADFWAFDPGRLRILLRLGVPAALQTILEVGVFAAATVLAGNLAPIQLAAHQVALSAAATTFMVPLGISSAAAVRVGYAIGRADGEAATRAGWSAILLAVVFMTGAAIAFVTVPEWIIGIFTTEPQVVEIGVALLGIAAAFQLFDGTQVVATGVLRGTGDTRSPMIATLVGYWVIGLPLGWVLCFSRGDGVLGLWIGLCAGLIAVATALLTVWSLRSRSLRREYRMASAVRAAS